MHRKTPLISAVVVLTLTNGFVAQETTSQFEKIEAMVPVRDGTMRGEAKALHRGRRTMVWEVRVTDGEDRLVALMTTAVHLRRNPHARTSFPDIEGADALGTVGLVRREGHQVDLELVQVDLHLAGRLRRIDVEQHAAGTGQLTDGGDVVDRADLVVDVHDRHQDGVLAQRRLDHRDRNERAGGVVDHDVTRHRRHGVDPGSLETVEMPGAMVQTRMPLRERSRAIGSVMPTTPPFEAE